MKGSGVARNALVSAAMAGIGGANASDELARAIHELEQEKRGRSRGKGNKKRPRKASGVAKSRRAAAKRANLRKHPRCRG